MHIGATIGNIERMSSRHQFHLKWSNYGHNLASSFIKLFESESLADVTLFCEGESYRAHRVVLAASSEHFQELFEQCSSAQNLVVILDGTSSSNLRALLEFMYKGEVYIDDANLNSFLQTAKRLQVKGLSLSQNELQSISSEGGEDRSEVKLPSGYSSSPSGAAGTTQDNILAQALGPIHHPPNQQQQQNSLGPQQGQQQQQQQQHPHHPHHGPPLKPNNHSPPGNNNPNHPNFSPPSPARSPASSAGNKNGHYDAAADKARKKIRLTSPRHGPYDPAEGGMQDGGPLGEYGGGGIQRMPNPSPQGSLNLRHLDLESVTRQNMAQNFGFPPHFSSPPSGGHHHQGSGESRGPQSTQSGQLQTIVITENPNVRKMRSASSENTMPEDLSIKLEVGREEEMLGLAAKQRSYSMDLGETPFGGLAGGHPWVSLPSPSAGGLSLSQQQQQQQQAQTQLDLNNAQTSADGKKLKCPFCDRLYGYETNLRAHIRQRHQGIRVPCPFCTRTFTRNNTVRRHVAREHRALLGGVRAFGEGGGPPGLPPGMAQGPPHHFGSPPSVGSANNSTGSPSQGSPSTSSSAGSGGLLGSGRGEGGRNEGGMGVSGAGGVASSAANSGLPLPPGGGGPSPPPLRPSSRGSSTVGSKSFD